MCNYKKSKGFSVVELMITIVIIGVLAAIAIPSYRNYRLKAEISSLIPLAQGKQAAIEEYVQTTRDTSCTNFETVLSAVQGNYPLQQIAYGNSAYFLTGPVFCMSINTVLGLNGTLTDVFSIGQIANSNSDGSISWSCGYVYFSISGPTSLSSTEIQQVVPANCTNYSSIAIH